MTVTGMRGLSGIGFVSFYLKSFPGVPSLAAQGREEWAEDIGQTIADVESPLNGQTLPNNNGSGGGTKRFIRGSTTSGTTGGTETHTHNLVGGSDIASGEGYSGCPTGAAGTLPPYYEMVMVIRIK